MSARPASGALRLRRPGAARVAAAGQRELVRAAADGRAPLRPRQALRLRWRGCCPRRGAAARGCLGSGAAPGHRGSSGLRRALDSRSQASRARPSVRARRVPQRRRLDRRHAAVPGAGRDRHVVYVQHLAETGQIPDDDDGIPVLGRAAGALLGRAALRRGGRPAARARHLRREYYDSAVDAVAQDPPNPANGRRIDRELEPAAALLRAGAPPPTSLRPWHDLLDRLWLMRLVSALLAALTTLFIFLFLREVLAEPWTWTVGALGGGLPAAVRLHLGRGASGRAALHRLGGAASSGSRARFGGGCTRSGARRSGWRSPSALLAKLNFVALMPGAVLALGLLVWRAGARPARPRCAARPCALGAAGGCGGSVRRAQRARLGPAPDGRVARVRSRRRRPRRRRAAAPITRREQLCYTWQLYLPRLPFMNDQFAYFPLWQTFFKGTIGRLRLARHALSDRGSTRSPSCIAGAARGAAGRGALAPARGAARALAGAA